MALKKSTGEYLRVAVMEGVNLNHGIAYIRIYEHETEEGRQEKPFEPDENYCVQEIKLNESQIDVLKKMGYDLVKNHKVKVDENIIPEEKDDKWNIVTEKTIENIYEYPYKDFIDC